MPFLGNQHFMANLPGLLSYPGNISTFNPKIYFDAFDTTAKAFSSSIFKPSSEASSSSSVDPSADSDYLTNLESWMKDMVNSADSQREEAKKDREWNAEQAQIAMNFEAEQAAMNRSFQIQSAREAMEFEQLEAEKLRQWQEVQNQKAMDYSTHMSNTAYQRAVSDLQKAGLNPILAYSRGASTPTGVSSSGASASGFSSSGSKASGFNSSGSQANVRGQITEIVGALSNLINSGAKIIDAFVPF